MNNLSWLRVGAFAICGLFACGDEGVGQDDIAEGDPCVPNESVPCECPGGASGAMVCDAEGTFGACSCEGDGTGDADADSGDGDGDSGDGDGDSGDGDGDSTGDGDGDGDSTGDGDGDGDTTGDGDGDSGWDGESTPSWSQHMVPFFQDSCGAGINGCHSREAYAAAVDSDCRGWLTLENLPLGAEFYAGPNTGAPTGCPDFVLYDRLTTLAPWQCAADSNYVVPSSLTDSYVWQKVQGTNLCEVSPGVLSEQMPPEDSGIVLTQMEKDMLEAWIVAGAPSDN